MEKYLGTGLHIQPSPTMSATRARRPNASHIEGGIRAGMTNASGPNLLVDGLVSTLQWACASISSAPLTRPFQRKIPRARVRKRNKETGLSACQLACQLELLPLATRESRFTKRGQCPWKLIDWIRPARWPRGANLHELQEQTARLPCGSLNKLPDLHALEVERLFS